MNGNIRIITSLLLAAVAAVLLGVALASFLPLIFTVILDSTPRTTFSTSGLAEQIRAALPAESLGFLGLAAVAAVIGLAADRLT